MDAGHGEHVRLSLVPGKMTLRTAAHSSVDRTCPGCEVHISGEGCGVLAALSWHSRSKAVPISLIKLESGYRKHSRRCVSCDTC